MFFCYTLCPNTKKYYDKKGNNLSFTQENKINTTKYCEGCAKKCTIGFITNQSDKTLWGTLPAINNVAIPSFYAPGNRIIDCGKIIDQYKLIHDIEPEYTAITLANQASKLCDFYQKQR